MPSSRLGIRRTRRPGHIRLHRPRWIDPFPGIPGTEPEKRIFAALVSRRIYFIFQGDFPIEDRYISGLLQVRNFKPDFIVPEWKVIFDPFSEFHHSLPDAIESDAWKSVYYESKGYEFIHPWSKDVEEQGGNWAINLSTRLHGPPRFPLNKEEASYKARVGYHLGPNLGLGSTSVAAANRKRRRPKALRLRSRR